MQPEVSRAGDRALLIDLGADVSAAALHAAAASARGWAGVVACVVGQQSLYVVFEDSSAVRREPLADYSNRCHSKRFTPCGQSPKLA